LDFAAREASVFSPPSFGCGGGLRYGKNGQKKAHQRGCGELPNHDFYLAQAFRQRERLGCIKSFFICGSAALWLCD
jgi:hypothetical protein